MPLATELLNKAQFEYENYLDSIFLHWKRGWITDEEMYTHRSMNRRWFSLIYSHVRPWYETQREALEQELIDKYDTDPKFPLCGIIFYHGEELPVYDDDYGQQVFTRWKDCEWSGGCYNLMYAELFCEELDNALEHELWKKMEADYTASE